MSENFSGGGGGGEGGSSSNVLYFRATQVGHEAISKPFEMQSCGLELGVVCDFGRYTSLHVCSTGLHQKLTKSEVIDNVASMVRLRECRKLYNSIDANCYTTLFNSAGADAWVWLHYCMHIRNYVHKKCQLTMPVSVIALKFVRNSSWITARVYSRTLLRCVRVHSSPCTSSASNLSPYQP